MGEYADMQIDKEMRELFGIGYEGSSNKPKQWKHHCEKCKKNFGSAQAVVNHMRDYHKQGASK